MKCRIMAVHPRDAFYTYAKIVGMRGELEECEISFYSSEWVMGWFRPEYSHGFFRDADLPFNGIQVEEVE